MPHPTSPCAHQGDRVEAEKRPHRPRGLKARAVWGAKCVTACRADPCDNSRCRDFLFLVDRKVRYSEQGPTIGLIYQGSCMEGMFLRCSLPDATVYLRLEAGPLLRRPIQRAHVDTHTLTHTLPRLYPAHTHTYTHTYKLPRLYPAHTHMHTHTYTRTHTPIHSYTSIPNTYTTTLALTHTHTPTHTPTRCPLPQIGRAHV